MKFRWFASALVLTALVAFVAGSAFTEEEQMSEEEMMAELMKLGMPGPAQKVLQGMAGDWDGAATMYMQSGAQESKATSTGTMLLGGRYLHVHFKGDFGGMPFEGIGIMAHDNFKKQYQNIWVDSFSSGISMTTGTCSEDGKTITLEGVWEGPMGKMPQKQVFMIEGPDRFRLEGSSKMGEDWHKDMEIVFTRKSSE